MHALIVDTHVTTGNINDTMPYLARLDRARAHLDLKVGAVGLDAGYFTPWACKDVVERGLCGVMGNPSAPTTGRATSTNASTPMIRRPTATDAKQLNGHRCARFRGLAKVQAQCPLSAACQNMKKSALLLARRRAAAP